MNKTSVYLDDDDLARVRRLQDSTGRSQSQLLRDGLRALEGDPELPPKPRSIGASDAPFDGQRRWTADELARRHGLA